LLKTLAQVNKKILRVIDYILKIQFLIMTFVVIVNVFLRYGFHTYLVWGPELSRYLLIWVSCLGGVVIMGEHVKIEFFRNALPPLTQKWLAITGDILVLFFLLVLVVIGIPFALRQMATSWATLPQFSKFWVYLAFPCFGAPAAIQVVERLIERFSKRI
jgi:TRAP-type C4-dicarboxylate transport system permease small subunit